jgi:DNA-binding NarL/FixJ family response regulator
MDTGKAFMDQTDQAGARVGVASRGAKRAVIVADNALIVAAIRSGVRKTGALELLGYVNPRQATAARIAQAGAQVVLIDESDIDVDTSIELIRALKELDSGIRVIVLTLDMEGDWVRRAFDVGANGAMSKAIHPVALATLVREAVCGHIVHAPTRVRPVVAAVPKLSDHSLLTDRELEILRLVASGATNGEIAGQLWITQQTVKFHVSNIYRKLGVANRTEACHYAHVNALVTIAELPRVERREPLALAL